MSPVTPLSVETMPPGVQTPRPYIPHLRWWICGLLFIATTINYVDRTALSSLKPMLEKPENFNWSEAQFAWIMFFFQAAYAIFPTISGRVIDSFGVKTGLAIALIGWSVMAGAHAFVGGLVGFCIVRFLLGAFEAANFPAAIKAVAQWFPQKERAIATGIFNSGTSLGVILTWGLVWIADKTSWKLAFIGIGISGLLWLILWYMLYESPRKHPRLNPEELAYIESGMPKQEVEKEKVHWTVLFRYKQVWPFLIGKFITDPVWWFYLYWLVSILVGRGMSNLKGAGMQIYPYSAAMFGAIAGGWFSGHLIKKGWKTGSARYAAMGICALCMPGSIVAAYADKPWVALIFISLACSAHQGWSSNIFTIASDLFPAKHVGSIVGMGTTAGGIGGMLTTLLVGVTLMLTKNNYTPILVWAGLMHITSLIIFFAMAGLELKRVEIDPNLDQSRPYLPLVVGGSILTVLGVVIDASLVIYRSQLLIQLKGWSGLAGGMTAAAMVSLIGLVLIYAGLPKAQRQN